MKWVFRAVPYLFVLLFVLVQPKLAHFDGNALYTDGSTLSDESTGEVWRIVFRDGAARYVTFSDYAMYHAPFVIVPGFILAILWIIVDLWRAGLFGADQH